MCSRVLGADSLSLAEVIVLYRLRCLGHVLRMFGDRRLIRAFLRVLGKSGRSDVVVRL